MYLVQAAGQELFPLYSHSLWTDDHLSHLLNHLFYLLPVSQYNSPDLTLFIASVYVSEESSNSEQRENIDEYTCSKHGVDRHTRIHDAVRPFNCSYNGEWMISYFCKPKLKV